VSTRFGSTPPHSDRCRMLLRKLPSSLSVTFTSGMLHMRTARACCLLHLSLLLCCVLCFSVESITCWPEATLCSNRCCSCSPLQVVVKVFKEEVGSNGCASDEIALTASLDHPNCTRALALINHPQVCFFLLPRCVWLWVCACLLLCGS
jgi:hypothetical protein